MDKERFYKFVINATTGAQEYVELTSKEVDIMRARILKTESEEANAPAPFDPLKEINDLKTEIATMKADILASKTITPPIDESVK